MLAVVMSPKGKHLSENGIVQYSENPDVKVGDACPKSVQTAVAVAKDLASEAATTLRERTYKPNPLAPPPPKIHEDLMDENGNLVTTNFKVTKLPEGLVNKRRQDGSLMINKKSGEPMLTTMDFRSEGAVKRRVVGSSKAAKGRVTGSTSGGQWAVPARPGTDEEANVGDIKKDLRTMDMERHRSTTRTAPVKGERIAPKRNVQRTYVD